jgi:hypothetical protein
MEDLACGRSSVAVGMNSLLAGYSASLSGVASATYSAAAFHKILILGYDPSGKWMGSEQATTLQHSSRGWRFGQHCV